MTPAVRIQARRAAGHRRCGRRHPAAPVLHPAGTFTAAEIAALLADPVLIVEALDAADAPDASAPSADAPPPRTRKPKEA